MFFYLSERGGFNCHLFGARTVFILYVCSVARTIRSCRSYANTDKQTQSCLPSTYTFFWVSTKVCAYWGLVLIQKEMQPQETLRSSSGDIHLNQCSKHNLDTVYTLPLCNVNFIDSSYLLFGQLAAKKLNALLIPWVGRVFSVISTPSTILETFVVVLVSSGLLLVL